MNRIRPWREVHGRAAGVLLAVLLCFGLLAMALFAAPREANRIRIAFAGDGGDFEYALRWQSGGEWTEATGTAYGGALVDRHHRWPLEGFEGLDITLTDFEGDAPVLCIISLYAQPFLLAEIPGEQVQSAALASGYTGRGVRWTLTQAQAQDLARAARQRLTALGLGIFLGLGLLLLAAACILGSKRNRGRAEARLCALRATQNRRRSWGALEYLGFALLLGGVILLLYFPYLRGKWLFLFSDASYDSFYQLLPHYLKTARDLQQGAAPWYDFSLALGQQSRNWVPVLDLLTAGLGARALPYMVGLVHGLKIFLAGSFFYAFLQKRGCSLTVRTVFGLGYALCGRMVLLGAMQSYPAEVVLLALLLWAFERFYQSDRQWKLLCAAFAVLCGNASFYMLLLYSAFLWGYALFRRLSAEQMPPFSAGRYYGKLCLVFGLGGVIALAMVYPDFSSLFYSARVDASLLGSSTSGLRALWESAAISDGFFLNGGSLQAFIGRLLSNGIFGVASDAGSMVHRLPSVYVSVCAAVLFPQCFCGAGKAAKRCYAAALGLAALYLFVPFVHNLANLMTYTSFNYKLASLWINVLLLYLAAVALQNLLRHNILSLGLLWGWIGVLFSGLLTLLLGWGAFSATYSIHPQEVYVAMLSLVLVGLLLTLLKTSSLRSLLCLCLVAFTLGDVSYNAWRSAYVREHITPARYQAVYESDLLTLLPQVQKEESDLFRLQYGSYGVPEYMQNYAVAYDYYGTSMYLGGTTFSGDYERLLASLERSSAGIHAFRGLDGMLELGSLLSVRYVLSDPSFQRLELKRFTPYGYRELPLPDEVSLSAYENTLALPFGFLYDAVLPQSAFDALPLAEKYRSFLYGAILEDGAAAAADLPQAQPPAIPLQSLDIEVGEAEGWVQVALGEAPPAGGGILLDVSARTNNAKDSFLRVREQPQAAGQADTALFAQSGSNRFLLPLQEVGDALWLQVPEGSIQEVQAYQLDAGYFADYEAAVQGLRAHALEITHFTQDHIRGQVEAPGESLLFLPIPYHEGWQITVDAEPVQALRANFLFLALPVSAGTHQVSLTFRPPLRVALNACALGSLALLLCLGGADLVRWLLRKQKESRKRLS